MKRFSILIAALCLCLTGCGKQTTEATAQIFAMDTVMEVAAYGPKAEEAVQEAEGQIKALENKLSRTKADSDVSRVNHNGTTPTTGLTYGTRALLPAAQKYLLWICIPWSIKAVSAVLPVSGKAWQRGSVMCRMA